MPVFAIYHVDVDPAKARTAAREALAFYLQAVGPTPMTAVYGINDQLVELLALGDLAKIAEQIPEEWLDWFTVSGTPEECVSKIAALHDAGATSVILSPYPPEEASRIVKLTAAEVLPAVGQQG
jgi:alkanesulfonate monooxygenase SsuD/methylene tetrahydromethanopterin reductase-like flavin-dependent oxidoreductase (luciferase family)